MKKLVLGVVVLVAFGLATLPARGAAGSTQEVPVLSAEDQVFLATLAALETVPAPELLAKRPVGIGTKAACSVNCGSTTISCPAGTASCSAVNRSCPGQPGYIVCNGVTTGCPICANSCEALFAQCESNCNGCVKSFQCSPYSCQCGRPCI
jgi:hypothetical protein